MIRDYDHDYIWVYECINNLWLSCRVSRLTWKVAYKPQNKIQMCGTEKYYRFKKNKIHS